MVAVRFHLTVVFGFGFKTVTVLMLSLIGHGADMVCMASYCRLWRLKPSPMKTVTSVFHLLNTSADRELRYTWKANNSGMTQSSIPWCYIGQDCELPATPYKDCRKVTKPE